MSARIRVLPALPGEIALAGREVALPPAADVEPAGGHTGDRS